MLDRSTPPTIFPIADLTFITPEVETINQSIITLFKGGDKDVIRIRVVFNAGSKYHNNPVIPVAVNALMKEGTANYSAEELADKLDYYGAFLQTEIDKDRASIELYCLSKHLNKVLPFFTEIIHQAEISEKEWDIYRTNAIKSLHTSQQKVGFLAKSKLQETLFNNHPYGTVVTEKHYQDVTIADLKEFYQTFIADKITHVELVGQFSEEDKTELLSLLSISKQQPTTAKVITPLTNVQNDPVFIPKTDAVQCAIVMGSLFPGRKHPDYFGVKVLICAFGGYFGSRLMANIREDKGYTYGIGAGLGSYLDQGVISISTEVGVDVKEAALKEIYFEMNRLINEPIPESELILVRNYMKGSLLKQCDGLFSQADLWNVLAPFDLDYDHIKAYLNVINTITSKELQNLAKVYLNKRNFTEVVAGGSL